MPGSDPPRPRRPLVRGLLVLLLAGGVLNGADIHVDQSYVGPPGDGSPGAPFLTIQEGVDAAMDGDRVIVAPGAYVENVLVMNKTVDLLSTGGPGQTTIDGASLATTLFLDNVGTSLIEGFRITGGLAGYGGGIELLGGLLPGEPTIRGNVIEGNMAVGAVPAGDGGGIDVYEADEVVIQDNLIRNNTSENEGGGINLLNSDSAVIAFNTIVGNSSSSGTSGFGPGISVAFGGLQEIASNVLAYNTSPTATGGMDIYMAGAYIESNVLYQDQPTEFVSTSGPLPPGNSVADPRFYDPAAGDLHLRKDSPGVDFAGPLAPPAGLDLDGNVRTLDGDGDGTPVPDAGCYEQLGEIAILTIFSDAKTVSWTAAFEPPDAYHVFRGDRASLLAGNMGACQDARDPVLFDRFFTEADVPAPGQMFTFVVNFELRTALSSLGLDSAGADRDPGGPCP